MIHDEKGWVSVVDSFQSAAVGGASWSDALSGFAHATGSRCGELIGLGASQAVPFNLITGVGPDWHEDFVRHRGADPAINPFVRFGSQLPPLKLMSSAEMLNKAERKKNAFLATFCDRHDTGHICLTPLLKNTDMLVGLAVLRSNREGEISAQQRKVFASIAPHIRTAVNTQLALEHRGASLVAGALEALSLTVFICDRTGTVKSMTPEAEALLIDSRLLQMSRGKLSCRYPEQTQNLRTALELAVRGLTRPGYPCATNMLLHDMAGSPLNVDILPMPRGESLFNFEPRALVVVRNKSSQQRASEQLLKSAYGLSSAETQIALSLIRGQTPEAIAAERGTSIATVRTQIRAIYTRMDIHRQSELIARFRDFG